MILRKFFSVFRNEAGAHLSAITPEAGRVDPSTEDPRLFLAAQRLGRDFPDRPLMVHGVRRMLKRRVQDTGYRIYIPLPYDRVSRVTTRPCRTRMSKVPNMVSGTSGTNISIQEVRSILKNTYCETGCVEDFLYLYISV